MYLANIHHLYTYGILNIFISPLSLLSHWRYMNDSLIYLLTSQNSEKEINYHIHLTKLNQISFLKLNCEDLL